MGKPEGVPAHPTPKHDSEHPGYETSDVNVGGVVKFVAALSGFLAVFFLFCFLMGKVINTELAREDGPASKWSAQLSQPGATPRGEKRQDLTSAAEFQQRQLEAVTKTFPQPILENDDGLQNVADLHAREDLLLENYSTSQDLPSGTIRIPIERAMQLVVQRGLPKAAAAPAIQSAAAQPMTGDQAPAEASATPGKTEQVMFGDHVPQVQAPLTDGFARTGYELDTIQAREEKVIVEQEKK